jgi:hypothetical protein
MSRLFIVVDMKTHFLVGLAAVAMCVAGSAVRADDVPDFSKGTQDFSLWERYGSNSLANQQNVYTTAASYGYYFLDNVSINPTFNAHYADWHNEDVVGAEITTFLRIHFWHYEKLSLFADIGVGAGYFDHRFPPGTSNFNFTAGGGLGLSYEISDHFYLIGGPRFDHYSNASIWGSDRHGSFNEVGGFIGVMWTF